MIDTRGPPERSDVNRVYEVDEEGFESNFYVEKGTGMIYEVKLFEDFAMIRGPILPEIVLPVTRLDLGTFTELFEEYCGDIKELRMVAFGARASHILIEKTKKK